MSEATAFHARHFGPVTDDTSLVYRAAGFSGVAVRFSGYPQRWEPWTTLEEDPDTGEEVEVETGEGEWVDDVSSGRVLVRMVGDDAKHEVDVSDLEPIQREDYCGECGQLGCAHDGLDRSEA